MRKISFALLAVVSVGLFLSYPDSHLAQISEAQAPEQSVKPCSGEKFVMPVTIAVGSTAFSDYLAIASLAVEKRQEAIARLSNEQKAGVFRAQYAMQIVTHPDMTKKQRDFILEAISKTTPDIYDKSSPDKVAQNRTIGTDLEAKAMSLFEPKKARSILAAIFSKKDAEIALLSAYADILKLGVQERRYVVKEMSIADRANIWRTQLAFHIATSTLNDTQKSLIAEMIPQVQSVLEAGQTMSKEAHVAYRAELEKNMLAIFQKNEAYAVFVGLGVQSNVKDTPSSAAFLKVSSNPLGPCNCNWYCTEDSQTCKAVPCRVAPACGPLGDWDCTNLCK